MSWRDGHVFITELPLPLHTALVAACNSVVEAATGTSNWHLKHYRSAMVASLSLLIEPDCSYGPDRGVGGSLPRGLLSWAEYHTVKVEIGVTRGWTQLDVKAGEWHRFPGVQYIVCIHVSSDRRVREYKLYDVVAGQPLAPVAPRPIEASTVLSLDSRRLLGLPASERFPTRFAQPSMRVSLSEIVTTAIAKQTN
ncbi:hypothetical protein SPRG_07145 [Saprolegnia parasitica CBS 223.65]|uniref:Uncharacterized protein n=1 Tax=Saprolegnia parasitica (strain CBS 223.65) TaxID=695850 RepID=A0A067CBJ9_SAPPC|nr:hypothetical protein SPRG_07145 [Saprolegnia parasitica CBS 223.65]KDO27873.1 hypothetical protein SPRG_07145 [Saprolegnia parasitica CBS 223.65]|eukprot:XP_012201331.1 hypothetical protein SPRG_07145 [Saprolegnia parasitica CBS 223.65]